MNIKEHKLSEKVFKKDRWYAVLDKSFEGVRRLPFANYIWLLNNPAFETIPKGYVIHHLDYDKTNDDISNLVLMRRDHHLVHHWKTRSPMDEVKIKFEKPSNPIEFCEPTSTPRVRFNKQRQRYYVSFNTGNGQSQKRCYVSTLNGKPISSLDEAEAVAKTISELAV